MRKWLYVLVLVFVVFSAKLYAGEVKAPFGLKWGETKSELEKNGVKFSNVSLDFNIIKCIAKKLPQNVSFAKRYHLAFDKKRGLQKVILVSHDFVDDIYGAEGKKLYSKLKKTLTKKYGLPESTEITGNKLYDKSDEFYQCLSYPGCGVWISMWEPTAGGIIGLNIEGVSRGHGCIELTYESSQWDKVIEDHKNRKNKLDEKAL